MKRSRAMIRTLRLRMKRLTASSNFGGELGGLEFAEGDELVGVEIHRPVDGGDAADEGGDGHRQADERGRGAEEDAGDARGEEGGEEGLDHESGGAEDAAGASIFCRRRRRGIGGCRRRGGFRGVG